MPPEQWRLAGAEVEVRGAGVDQRAEQLVHGGPGLGQLGGAAPRRHRREPEPAPPAARTVTDGPPAPGVSATVTCPLGERYGKLTSSDAAEARGRVGVGDLAHERQDLRVGQRILGERARRAVGHERGGLAHDELKRVGALLIQDLNQAIEPSHGSLSRGDAPPGRATC